MRGYLILSVLAIVSVLYYVSRIESFISIKSSNLRSVSNEENIDSFFQDSFSNVDHDPIIDEQRRLVVVHDAEGLRASLLPDRLNQALSWDILIECHLPIYISTPLIIPSDSDIRISSPYWSNPPNLIAREATRIFKMETNSILELSNVLLSSGAADDGGAVYNDGGKLSISGCLLTNHTATGRGGAIFSKNGEVKLENTSFSGCSAGDAGGGIFVASASQIKTKDKHHQHGRKLVSFSRVIFNENDAPSGADFILGEHEAYESSSHFFSKLFTSSSTSSWFLSLFLASLFGGMVALSASRICQHVSHVCQNHIIVKKCFKNILFNGNNDIIPPSSSSSSLSDNNVCSSEGGDCSQDELPHHTSSSSSISLHTPFMNGNQHHIGHHRSNQVDDDDYDIEMLSSISHPHYQVNVAECETELIKPLVRSAKHSSFLDNVSINTLFNLKKKNSDDSDGDHVDQFVGFDLFIKIKDMFQMTLVARGSHSSVYRGVIKTNGSFGILPPTTTTKDQQDSVNHKSRVIAIKRLTYDFKKISHHKKRQRILKQRKTLYLHGQANREVSKDDKEEEEGMKGEGGEEEFGDLDESELEFLNQWRNECAIMSSLSPHVNVLGLIGVIADHESISIYHGKDSPFGLGLVLEWLPGSLRDALDAGLLPPNNSARSMVRGHDDEDDLNFFTSPSSSSSSSPLSVLSSRIALDITKGLIHLHTHNVVHRDLKATNIMLDQAGRAKLSDFGIAVFQTSQSNIEANQPSKSSAPSSASRQQIPSLPPLNKQRPEGTLLYAAPELLKQEGQWNSKTSVDLWSLGMVVIELYTGTPLLHLWRKSSEHEALYGGSLQRQQHQLQQHSAATPSSSCHVHNSRSLPLAIGSAGRLPNMLQACGWRPDLRELNLAKQSLGGLLNQSWAFAPQERPKALEFLSQLEEITQSSDVQEPSSRRTNNTNNSFDKDDNDRHKRSSSSLSSASFKNNSEITSVLRSIHDQEQRIEAEQVEAGDFLAEPYSPNSPINSSNEMKKNMDMMSTDGVITAQPHCLQNHKNHNEQDDNEQASLDPPYAHAAALDPTHTTQQTQHHVNMIQEEDDLAMLRSLHGFHEHESNPSSNAATPPSSSSPSSSSSSSQFSAAWGGWFTNGSALNDSQTSRTDSMNTLDRFVPSIGSGAEIEPLEFD